MTITAATIAQEMAAGLAEAERQMVFLRSAAAGDVPNILSLMDLAAADDADPRLLAGLAALRRVLLA